jgi:hypothetical protein
MRTVSPVERVAVGKLVDQDIAGGRLACQPKSGPVRLEVFREGARLVRWGTGDSKPRGETSMRRSR